MYEKRKNAEAERNTNNVCNKNIDEWTERLVSDENEDNKKRLPELTLPGYKPKYEKTFM